MKEYAELLEEAYRKIPKKAFSQERFEIPTVRALTEGNRTFIRNFDQVVATLRRDPQMIVKFLNKELAVPMSIENERLIIQGKFRERVLNERIAAFTRLYVLCKTCGKPDTKLMDAERGVKMLVCEACGAKAPAGR